jgi:hypothetical protein
MRTAATFALLALLCGLAGAQTPPKAPVLREAQGTLPGDQRIERIRVEDEGATIDELRVGGQTQSITVQPKAALPEYEIIPSDGARGSGRRDERTGDTGQRVWNVLKF